MAKALACARQSAPGLALLWGTLGMQCGASRRLQCSPRCVLPKITSVLMFSCVLCMFHKVRACARHLVEVFCGVCWVRSALRIRSAPCSRCRAGARRRRPCCRCRLCSTVHTDLPPAAQQRCSPAGCPKCLQKPKRGHASCMPAARSAGPAQHLMCDTAEDILCRSYHGTRRCSGKVCNTLAAGCP